MSVTTTVTCDHCQDSEEVQTYYGSGMDLFDLPDGWQVDPDNDEHHLCEWCSENADTSDDEWPRRMSGHPNPARAITAGDGFSGYPTPPGCAPNHYCGKCRECLRQGLWDGKP